VFEGGPFCCLDNQKLKNEKGTNGFVRKGTNQLETIYYVYDEM
jgi:hypothetical protein